MQPVADLQCCLGVVLEQEVLVGGEQQQVTAPTHHIALHNSDRASAVERYSPSKCEQKSANATIGGEEC